MINAIAIDDEPIALKILADHASKLNYLNLVKTFTNPFEGIEYLKTFSATALFLDIKMHDISGIDVAELIPGSVPVIFTTAYPDYAIMGFELNAVDYLLKPISFTRFLKACHKLKNQFHLAQKQEILLLKDGNHIKRIKSAEVYYIEATGNYLKFFTTQGVILHRNTVKGFIEDLNPHEFIRIHKSYIVNIQHITRIEANQITIDNYQIPLSPTYKSEVWTKLGVS